MPTVPRAVKSSYSLLAETGRGFSEDNCSRMAAALAYYTIFAMPPLLVIVIMICGVFFDPSDVEGRLSDEIRGFVGERGAEQVQTMIRAAQPEQHGLLARFLGPIVLLIGASGAMIQLQGALNDVWSVKPDPSRGGVKNFLVKRLLSFAMVLSIAFLLLVSLVLTAVISAASEYLLPQLLGEPALHAINFLVTLALITVLFAAIYKVVPDVEVQWREVWGGALLASFLFGVGKFGLGMYFGKSNVGSAYGAAGALILVLVWIYYSGMILLLGAEFTQAWAKLRGGGVVPSSGAVQVVEEIKLVRPEDIEPAECPVTSLVSDESAEVPVAAGRSSREGESERTVQG